MKNRYIILCLIVIGISTHPRAWAQVRQASSDTLMKVVLENNRTLKVAREAYHVAILKAGTGNTPPNPEVEFGYLFGKPATIGNRIDFSVSQQVDFPTVYIHKSQLKKVKSSQAELQYVVSRQEVLFKARQLWIERVYDHQLKGLLSHRLKQATTLNDHFRQKLESGEVSQLIYNQSNLQLAALEGEYEKVLNSINNNQHALNEVCGGGSVEIEESELPSLRHIFPDSLLKDYQSSAYKQLYQLQSQLKENQKNLVVSQQLPKLSAGYFSESVLDQQFRGLQVGVTVPLWENSNRIKHAKSEVIFAEADAERFSFLQKKEVLQKLDEMESLKSRTDKLQLALDTGNSLELLSMSMINGEISLAEYFYASDFYFQNQQLLLEYKRDQLLMEAELLKVYL